jgi:hypothetical protein
MPHRQPDDHERAAAGLDFDHPIREKAASIGQKVAEHGPEVLLDEIENLLPEAWREQIRSFPMAALALGLGVGIYLGMKRSEEVIGAGTTLVSAAAMSNLNGVFDKFRGEE